MYNQCMCIRLCVLGSGSKGNCIYVGYDKTHILIDAGLPIRRMVKFISAMGIAPESLSVLITHEHSDHIKTLDALTKKYPVCVYASEKSRGGLSRACDISRGNYIFFGEEDFFVGQFTVSPFAVSHDVPCVGYTLSAAGKILSAVTDIGKVTPKVLRAITGSDLVVLESNHDVEMLHRNAKYSAFLKKRILSSHGHLSNDECATAVCLLAASGTKQVILAHLSQENNCPELAFETTKKQLELRGYTEGKDIKVEVAEQNSLSAMYEIV